jgi:NADPH:quinone reductase
MTGSPFLLRSAGQYAKAEIKSSQIIPARRHHAPRQNLLRFLLQEKTVKAIRVHQFGGPEVLKLEDVPDPQPGAGQVVVRVHAAGVNPVEAYIRTGTYAAKPPLPYTPGTDAGGLVLAVGSGVKCWKEGDRVYTTDPSSGTYAEQALCHEGQLQPLPDNVSFEQGAAMGVPYGTAYRGLFARAEAKPAETILVHGASGGVGTATVQLARAAGMTIIGTAGTEEGMKLVKDQGATHVLNHSSEGYLDELIKLTDGRGVDVIIEFLANKNLARDLTVLAKKGRVAVIGNRGTIEINPRDAMSREADIRGVTLMSATDGEYRAMHAALVAGLETGTLRPVIGHKFSLAEAARAHEEIIKPSGAHGKIVLIP